MEGAYNYTPSPPLTRLHTYTAKYNPQKLLVKYENTSSHVQETNKKDLLVFSVIILTPPSAIVGKGKHGKGVKLSFLPVPRARLMFPYTSRFISGWCALQPDLLIL